MNLFMHLVAGFAVIWFAYLARRFYLWLLSPKKGEEDEIYEVVFRLFDNLIDGDPKLDLFIEHRIYRNPSSDVLAKVMEDMDILNTEEFRPVFIVQGRGHTDMMEGQGGRLVYFHTYKRVFSKVGTFHPISKGGLKHANPNFTDTGYLLPIPTHAMYNELNVQFPRGSSEKVRPCSVVLKKIQGNDSQIIREVQFDH